MKNRPFINFTNHPSSLWGKRQKTQAEAYGEITDVLFPQISPSADDDEIAEIAREYALEIAKTNPAAVLCQGEYSLCFAVSDLLINKGILVLFACSVRQTDESAISNGCTQKISQYEFVRFRKCTKMVRGGRTDGCCFGERRNWCWRRIRFKLLYLDRRSPCRNIWR